MTRLLFLAQRIPYPLNKGEKIRAYHVLRHLAERHEVKLGAFIDDPTDEPHATIFKDFCSEIFLPKLDPKWARLTSLKGFIRQEPLSLSYFHHSPMRNWTRHILEQEKPEYVYVFSSNMAQYVMNTPVRSSRFIMDYCDVDSEKFNSYAQNSKFPMRWLYTREAKKLQTFERQIANSCDAGIFISDAEAALFRNIAPESTSRISTLEACIDSTYFNPNLFYKNPYPKNRKIVVFTGAMDYRPNIDAVTWYSRNIFPRIRQQQNNVQFWIVGANPTRSVTLLTQDPSIHVTGRVTDIRPYLAHADLAVAPLRIARGVQYKVLEAMCMAKSVLVTPAVLNGIPAKPAEQVLLGNSEEELVAKTLMAFEATLSKKIGHAARKFVLSRYNWKAQFAKLDEIIKLCHKASPS